MKRLSYMIREAFANIRINRTTTFIAVGTTAFTLACFGIFLLLYLNLRGVVDSLQEDIHVVLYVEDTLSSPGLSALRGRLAKDPEVASIAYISKEQALLDFREQFPSDQVLLEGLGANPLPASLIVTLAPQFRSPASVKRWSERHRALEGVEQVHYSRDWVENLETLMGYLELAAVSLGAFLSAASVAIIASTIRLTLYARRDEIEIMRMIGATGAFIKIPYLLEGAILGTLGGGLAVALLKGSFEFFRMQLGSAGHFLGVDAGLGFFPFQVTLLLLSAGLILGWAGSFVSLLDIGRVRW